MIKFSFLYYILKTDNEQSYSWNLELKIQEEGWDSLLTWLDSPFLNMFLAVNPKDML
jgi:hypothetical protein